MITMNDLKYSKQLGELSDYVFIDGVCVKSRMRSETKPTIQEAIQKAKIKEQSVLIQSEKEVKIYVDNKKLNYYKKWIADMNHSLAQAFKNKDILIMTEKYKNGYDFNYSE